MMVDMDITKLPKQLCENIAINFTDEYFAMALISGEDVRAYALTPAHMKRLAQYAAFQVAEYEKRNGSIAAEWKLGTPSPIQTNDLGGGEG